MTDLYKRARKLVVGILGSTILVIGIAMIVLPGPAFIIIPLGLAILATEFIWARRLLNKVRLRIKKMQETGMDQTRKD